MMDENSIPTAAEWLEAVQKRLPAGYTATHAEFFDYKNQIGVEICKTLPDGQVYRWGSRAAIDYSNNCANTIDELIDGSDLTLGLSRAWQGETKQAHEGRVTASSGPATCPHCGGIIDG
jgi:hypothetical protein